jgi:predicted dehydrogenase
MPQALDRASSARWTSDLEDVLADDALDAVVIATPVPTHAALAERTLKAGKSCFVEKPLAQRVEDAERIAALAESARATLMVGHLLVYHPGLEALKALAQGEELGDIQYIYSQRLNLGRLRTDENALWSLGAHDVSMVLALTGELPVEVTARGQSYVRDGVEDVVFGLLRFPSGIVAHMHLSWLDPHKERRITVVGSRRMASFDDMADIDKVTIFDKGFDQGLSRNDFVLRAGESRTPLISDEEPLRAELRHYIACVRGDGEPRSGAESGTRVVRVLDALQSSLESDGESIGVSPETLS